MLCSFLVCSSVYVPVLALPHRQPGVGQGLELALSRVLELARFSLSVPQESSDSAEAAFPFRAKQDHAGAVCILKLCMGCNQELAGGGAEVFQAIRADHATQLARLLQQAPGALQPPSLLVLTQSLSLVAQHRGELAGGLLSDCLAALAAAAGGTAALTSAAEVMQRCRAQRDALGASLETAWPSFAEACGHAEPEPLAKLLGAIAEGAPVGSLGALSRLIAQAFERRAEARVALFSAAVSLAHRAKEEPVAAAGLLEELLLGLSQIAWAELDAGGALGQRLMLVADPMVRHSGEAEATGCELSERERALLEAWSRCVWEVGRHAPHCLGLAASRLVLRAAAAAIAAPTQAPPARTLALLREPWSDEALRARWRHTLDEPAAEATSALGLCSLGALVMRGLLKALVGQMPITAVGVVVPAARGLLEIGGAAAFAAWASRAVEGEGFPEGTKAEAKERFVRELSSSGDNTTHFKQLLKRFCTRKGGT